MRNLLVFLLLFPMANAQAQIQFEDVSEKAGIADLGVNAAGGAFGDYDNDGDVDIYVSASDPISGLRNRLWENDGTGHFTDVAIERGVAAEGSQGRGVSWGDYDNDGDIDLIIATMGSYRRPADQQVPTKLYKNLLVETGEPNFEDVTRSAGLMRKGNADDARVGGIGGTGAGIAWADYNHDGFLDVLHRSSDDDLDIALFRNNGDGTFTEVTKEAGVGILGKVYRADSQGNGAWFDFDLDGRVDLLVSNEHEINLLFHNNGDGTFTDITENRQPPSGTAFLNPGNTDGTCVGDIDNDGDMDVYLVNADQANRLIRNDIIETGTITFTDITFSSGTGDMGGGRGCTMADFDNDGFLDIYVNNGGPANILINDIIPTGNPFSQYYVAPTPGRNVLYRNNGDGTFSDITEGSGAEGNGIGTGVSSGDVNNDGFPDIFVTNRTYYNEGKRISEPQTNRLFLNKGNDNNWIKVKLVGTKSNRNAYNARVKLVAGDLEQVRELFSANGYNSADDPTLIFGLGKRDSVDSIEVFWPSGAIQHLEDLSPGQTVTITESQ